MELYFLEIDFDTGSQLTSTKLVIDEEKLHTFLKAKTIEQIHSYEIFREDYENIKKIVIHFKVNIISTENKFCLRKAVKFDKLPYVVHTNRELFMMIYEEKPLSVFSSYVDDNHDIYGGQKFEELSALHNIKKSIKKVDDIIYTFFYQPSEEWRVDTYLRIKLAEEKFGNNLHIEWMIGRLLGYSQLENEAYLEMFYNK